MKKKILFCFLVLGVVAMSSIGTLAYFTSQDTAVNAITAGDIEIKLNETALSDDGQTTVPFENRQIGIMPGTTVSKIVSVENIGSQPAYIRVKLEKDILLSGDKTDEADPSLITYDINLNDWTEKDGWYYYNSILPSGEETKPLFTKVMFDSDMDNLYENSKTQIKINAEATQTANNGKNALAAAGWPESDKEE